MIIYKAEYTSYYVTFRRILLVKHNIFSKLIPMYLLLFTIDQMSQGCPWCNHEFKNPFPNRSTITPQSFGNLPRWILLQSSSGYFGFLPDRLNFCKKELFGLLFEVSWGGEANKDSPGLSVDVGWCLTSVQLSSSVSLSVWCEPVRPVGLWPFGPGLFFRYLGTSWSMCGGPPWGRPHTAQRTSWWRPHPV